MQLEGGGGGGGGGVTPAGMSKRLSVFFREDNI